MTLSVSLLILSSSSLLFLPLLYPNSFSIILFSNHHFLPLIFALICLSFSFSFFYPSCAICRNAVESVLLRTPEDGDHQPRPADHDQRGHHPPLGVGARAERGLEAPRRRVDHRLQEHLRLPQVGFAPKTCEPSPGRFRRQCVNKRWRLLEPEDTCWGGGDP